MFQRLGGRHEDVQQPVPNLGDHRRRRRGVVVLEHRVVRLRRQRVAHGKGIDVEPRAWRLPADGIQRQPQSRRRIPGQQHDAAAPQSPVGAGPARVVGAAVQRQHEGGRGGGRFVEAGQQRGPAGAGVGGGIVAGVHRIAFGQPNFGRQPVQGVLVGGPHLCQWQPQAVGDRGEHLAGRLGVDRCGRCAAPGVGQQRVVRPQRPPVGAPVQRNLPARQRFSGIPTALPALDQPARCPHRLQSGGQIRCPLPLVGPVGRRGPLLGDLVVHRHERRLTADGQPDVGGGQPLVDPPADLADRLPRLVGVGQRDARVFVDARDGVGEFQHRCAGFGAAADRRRRRRVRRGRQRDVALTGEQPRRRVQTDPARTGDVHLRPRVQVGEVGDGSRRPVERLDVGCQLHQVAGHEAGGQPQLAQDRHQQPRRVPARPDPAAQRVIRGLHALFHPHAVRDVGADRAVERDQQVDGASALGHREGSHPGPDQLAGARPVAGLIDGPQVRLQVVGDRLGVGQSAGGPRLGPVLDEEVERIDDLQVGNESDGDGQPPHGIRKHQPRKEVAHRVLLPVDEVRVRLDAQRVGLDGRAAVGRRAQPHDVRIHPDQPIKGVAGAVLQRNFDAHNR